MPRKPKQLVTPIDDGCYLIEMNKGYSVVVDEADVDLAFVRWSVVIYPRSAYAMTSASHHLSQRRMHRLILERLLGRPILKNEFVDHRDSNGLNNRRENIRIATPSQNVRNSRSHLRNTSGFKGVSERKDMAIGTRRFTSIIYLNGKNVNLGYFFTPEEAYDNYCRAAVENFGEFAQLR